jgi:deoxyinosine 3'endonuclease (endonuclease V)
MSSTNCQAHNVCVKNRNMSGLMSESRYKQAIINQKELAHQVIKQNQFQALKLIAGVDVSNALRNNYSPLYAAVTSFRST